MSTSSWETQVRAALLEERSACLDHDRCQAVWWAYTFSANTWLSKVHAGQQEVLGRQVRRDTNWIHPYTIRVWSWTQDFPDYRPRQLGASNRPSPIYIAFDHHFVIRGNRTHFVRGTGISPTVPTGPDGTNQHCCKDNGVCHSWNSRVWVHTRVPVFEGIQNVGWFEQVQPWWCASWQFLDEAATRGKDGVCDQTNPPSEVHTMRRMVRFRVSISLYIFSLSIETSHSNPHNTLGDGIEHAQLLKNNYIYIYTNISPGFCLGPWFTIHL